MVSPDVTHWMHLVIQTCVVARVNDVSVVRTTVVTAVTVCSLLLTRFLQ